MKIYNKINTKIILVTALSILFFPIAVWGQTTGGWVLANTYGLPEGTLTEIASNILSWILEIFAILGIVGFVISGIIYLVSTGDETAISRAKQAMLYSILGVIVGLSGYLIMQAVDTMLMGGSRF